jgi:hypothetical protein
MQTLLWRQCRMLKIGPIAWRARSFYDVLVGSEAMRTAIRA